MQLQSCDNAADFGMFDQTQLLKRGVKGENALSGPTPLPNLSTGESIAILETLSFRSKEPDKPVKRLPSWAFQHMGSKRHNKQYAFSRAVGIFALSDVKHIVTVTKNAESRH